MSNDSTNLLPIAFHQSLPKGIFESTVGLNFFTLCCKWSQWLWKKIWHSLYYSLFLPPGKNLWARALELALGKMVCFPAWHPHFKSWTLSGGGSIASGLLDLPLPAWLYITSWGKGNRGPGIISSVAPMAEPLFHKQGLGRRSSQLLATLNQNLAVETGSLGQDKKWHIWELGEKGSPVSLVVTLWSEVFTLLSWDGRGRAWILVQIVQTHCSYWGLVDFFE